MTRMPLLISRERRQLQLVDLLERIIRRDERALAELQKTLGRELYWAVLPVVRRHASAEEVVADCFWQIWMQAERYVPERGAVRAWIATIARSRAIDFVRKRGRVSRYEESIDDDADCDHDLNGEEFAEQTQRQGFSSTSQLENDDRDACVRRLLERVAPAHRQMLALAFFSGLSHGEIASHCGLPLGTVKSHLRRGLAELRPLCLRAGLADGRLVGNCEPEPELQLM